MVDRALRQARSNGPSASRGSGPAAVGVPGTDAGPAATRAAATSVAGSAPVDVTGPILPPGQPSASRTMPPMARPTPSCWTTTSRSASTNRPSTTVTTG